MNGFQATKKDVAKALALFRRTITALKKAKLTGEDGLAVIEREIGMAALDDAVPVIEAVTGVADQDLLITAAERYSVMRRFIPRFLAAFQFQSIMPNDPVLAAKRAIEGDGPHGKPRSAKERAIIVPAAEVV